MLRCKSLKCTGHLNSLNSVENIRSVVIKFNSQTQEAWNRMSLSIKTKQKRVATFDDLVEFVCTQSQLVNNPEYSKDAFVGAKDKRSSNPPFKSFYAQCDETERDGDEGSVEDEAVDNVKCQAVSVSVSKEVCPLCQGDHILENCATLKVLTIEERVSAIMKLRL